MAVDAHHGPGSHPCDDAPHEVAELGRNRVPDRVRDVHRGRARVDDRLVDSQQELGVRARGVLGAELDLSVAAKALTPVAHPAHGGSKRLLPGHAQLVLEVDVARGDEDMEMRALGGEQRLHGPLRVAVAAPGEPGHRHALRLARDPLDRLEVARRRRREAGLDHVHVEPDQLPRDLDLLGDRETGTRRLLAVAKGGVEDPDRTRDGDRGLPGYAGYLGCTHDCPSAVAVAAVPAPLPSAEACA